MGLSGAKNRRKISKDPNNTAWSRNTESFGQKMLRSHGWEPGQYLGAKDAPHAELHTEANASHIRVLLKDDNLGIGARRNQGDECTGLDVFKDLLGRLNGKSEDTIQKEQQFRQDARMSAYMHHKYGAMRFVSGGLLVGDKIEELVAQSSGASKERAEKSEVDDKPKKEKKSKKRKADADLETDDSEETSRKDKKKRRKDKSSEENTPAQTEDEDAAEAKRIKKEKKRRKKEARAEADAAQNDESQRPSKSDKKRKKEKLKESETSATNSEAASEAEPSPAPHLNRHLARRKFIAQKRRAVMDPSALKQIFMIKT